MKAASGEATSGHILTRLSIDGSSGMAGSTEASLEYGWVRNFKTGASYIVLKA
jgi:hypothetical protein